MTTPDLRAILGAAGLPAAFWQLPDSTYETVSTGWVLDNWNAWLDARPAQLVVFGDIGGKRIRKRPLWIAEVGDCDNLALGNVAHGQVGNALASVAQNAPRGGLAFGCLFYIAQQRVTGPHAINWLVDHDKAVRFFEPGDGTFVELNTEERSTSWFGLAV